MICPCSFSGGNIPTPGIRVVTEYGHKYDTFACLVLRNYQILNFVQRSRRLVGLLWPNNDFKSWCKPEQTLPLIIRYSHLGNDPGDYVAVEACCG